MCRWNFWEVGFPASRAIPSVDVERREEQGNQPNLTVAKFWPIPTNRLRAKSAIVLLIDRAGHCCQSDRHKILFLFSESELSGWNNTEKVFGLIDSGDDFRAIVFRLFPLYSARQFSGFPIVGEMSGDGLKKFHARQRERSIRSFSSNFV